MAGKKSLIERGIRLLEEEDKKSAKATRGQREYDKGIIKGAIGGGAATKALDALTEKPEGTDLGEGAVISYEDGTSKEKEPKKEAGRLGFPAKKAKGGRPLGVGAAQKGYGAVMRKSVGGGLRGVGVAQRGFGAVKKAGKE